MFADFRPMPRKFTNDSLLSLQCIDGYHQEQLSTGLGLSVSEISGSIFLTQFVSFKSVITSGQVNVLECMRFRVAIGQGKVLECMRFHLCGLWSQLHCLLWTLPLVSWFHLLCIYAIAGWWFAIYRSPVAEGKKTFIRQPRQFLNFTQLTWLLPHINTAPYKWQPVELISEQPVALHMELYLALVRIVCNVFQL